VLRTGVLLLATVLSGCAGLPLHSDEGRIRGRILEVTPLGTSVADARKIITTKIKQETFRESHVLDETAFHVRLGTIDRWPLPFLPLTYTDVYSVWIFSGADQLREVNVWKDPGWHW
jgi:hypothetical protein